MYVSEIHFNVDPVELQRVLAHGGDIVERLRRVPGCRQVLVLRTAVDRLTSYVAYDSRAQAEEAMGHFAEFFAQVAPYLTLLPQRQIYPAVMFEQFQPSI